MISLQSEHFSLRRASVEISPPKVDRYGRPSIDFVDQETGAVGRVVQEADSYEVDSVRSPNGGRGGATRVMEAITQWADENGVNLTLYASPYYGSDPQRLVEFYERFGFTVTGEHPAGTEMSRVVDDEQEAFPTLLQSETELSEDEAVLFESNGVYATTVAHGERLFVVDLDGLATLDDDDEFDQFYDDLEAWAWSQGFVVDYTYVL